MSALTKKLELRSELLAEAFEGYDRAAGYSNWIAAGNYAAEARDLALVGRILCVDLAKALDSAGYGSAKEFYAWADRFESDYRTACALIEDVEVYIDE